MDAILWLIVIIACMAVEIMTLGLTAIWFAGGALIAFIAALLSVGWMAQLILFVVFSAVTLVFTRPFALKYINKGAAKTNYESMAGRVGEVTEQIDNLKATGCVRVAGQDWTARAAEEAEIIPAGSQVMIKQIEGVKLIVAPVKKEETV